MATSNNAIPSPQQAINFLNIIEKLKTTPRTGWVKRGVKNPESIADHMYRMGVMSLLVQGTSYDYAHCMKLAIVHDIAESIAGDITPVCGITDDEKYKMESAALAELKKTLGDCMAADDLEALWLEYEQGETNEAQLVKDFDKIEMILQASEYESAQGSELQEFFDSTAGKWRTEIGQSWAEEICKRRREGMVNGAPVS
ncbi:hypothetical protein Ndes2526B_g05760 [Nannochloris sp. 'desiccata']|nr:putative 5'-deoxynucleotidase HDDC2 [Chlorella desiccata (nom. nud.)]